MHWKVVYDYLIGIGAEKLDDLAQFQGWERKSKIEELEIKKDTYS